MHSYLQMMWLVIGTLALALSVVLSLVLLSPPVRADEAEARGQVRLEVARLEPGRPVRATIAAPMPGRAAWLAFGTSPRAQRLPAPLPAARLDPSSGGILRGTIGADGRARFDDVTLPTDLPAGQWLHFQGFVLTPLGQVVASDKVSRRVDSASTSGSFTDGSDEHLPSATAHAAHGEVDFGDLDGDGDVDLVLSGERGSR